MNELNTHIYYLERKSELLSRFSTAVSIWQQLIKNAYGLEIAERVAYSSLSYFESLLIEIPYIGGDQNHLSGTLIEAVMCLALYKAMQKGGKSCLDTGKVLYDWIVITCQLQSPEIPTANMLSPEEMMEWRRQRAQQSQKRKYLADWVYQFVDGDGIAFDYGYDFSECAALKFFKAQGAVELTPFFCFLDFPKSKAGGFGLERNYTLAEGCNKCDHRFKKGRKTELEWPPPFLRI